MSLSRQGGRMKDVEIVVFQDKSWIRFTEYQKLKDRIEQENKRLKEMMITRCEKIDDLRRINKKLKAKLEQ